MPNTGQYMPQVASKTKNAPKLATVDVLKIGVESAIAAATSKPRPVPADETIGNGPINCAFHPKHPLQQTPQKKKKMGGVGTPANAPVCCSGMPPAMADENRYDPSMTATIKVAKIRPKGGTKPTVCSVIVGVHMNTKVYIAPS